MHLIAYVKKVKVNFTLEQAMKAQACGRFVALCVSWGVGGQRHSPGNKHGTHTIRMTVGPRAGVHWCGKSCLKRDSIPGPFSLQERIR